MKCHPDRSVPFPKGNGTRVEGRQRTLCSLQIYFPCFAAKSTSAFRLVSETPLTFPIDRPLMNRVGVPVTFTCLPSAIEASTSAFVLGEARKPQSPALSARNQWQSPSAFHRHFRP